MKFDPVRNSRQANGELWHAHADKFCGLIFIQHLGSDHKLLRVRRKSGSGGRQAHQGAFGEAPHKAAAP
jgi:hypothetical protein